jgi:hypothetical protein
MTIFAAVVSWYAIYAVGNVTGTDLIDFTKLSGKWLRIQLHE